MLIQVILTAFGTIFVLFLLGIIVDKLLAPHEFKGGSDLEHQIYDDLEEEWKHDSRGWWD
jgi:hypothetical protein